VQSGFDGKDREGVLVLNVACCNCGSSGDLRNMRLVRHVESMGEKNNAYKNFIGKLGG
jgi:hypothetical protein